MKFLFTCTCNGLVWGEKTYKIEPPDPITRLKKSVLQRLKLMSIPSRTKVDTGALYFQRLLFTIKLSPDPIKDNLICVVLK